MSRIDIDQLLQAGRRVCLITVIDRREQWRQRKESAMQQAKGNALTAYCDREIAELHALIRAYPEETALWQRRIGQWQHIKAQQLGVSADDRLQAAYASLTK